MDDREWVEIPDPGWTRLAIPESVRRNSFVSGDDTGRRFTVAYYRVDSDGSFRAKVTFGPEVQGPPGHAHGGSMAAVLDEAMGSAGWIAGHKAVVAELTTRFRGMLPLGSRCVVEARVERVEGRRVWVSGSMRTESGRVVSDGEAMLVALNEKQIQQLGDSGAENFFVSGES